MLSQKREDLVTAAERRTTILAWAGLGYMALQFGFLARLTWWEYSWDIMEPVTYFVTYGTAMGAYAYYVLTRQVRQGRGESVFVSGVTRQVGCMTGLWCGSSILCGMFRS